MEDRILKFLVKITVKTVTHWLCDVDHNYIAVFLKLSSKFLKLILVVRTVLFFSTAAFSCKNNDEIT